MRYVDANVFIRMITNDHPAMTRAAKAFFLGIEQGKEVVAVLESTVAEVAFVLGSPRIYRLPAIEIRDRLLALLSLAGVRMEDKSRCLRALDIYAAYQGINFGDALIAAASLAEAPHEVYSFDRGFDAVEGVGRVEP